MTKKQINEITQLAIRVNNLVDTEDIKLLLVYLSHTNTTIAFWKALADEHTKETKRNDTREI